MSINYSERDPGLEAIVRSVRASFGGKSLKTYHIYGIRNDSKRPMLAIATNSPISERLLHFLERSKIRADIADDLGNDTVRIGIRRDLRKDSKFCINLIKTIIYAQEGKLKSGDFTAKHSFPVVAKAKKKKGGK